MKFRDLSPILDLGRLDLSPCRHLWACPPRGDLSKFELHQNILLPVPNTWISGMALKLFGFWVCPHGRCAFRTLPALRTDNNAKLFTGLSTTALSG